MTLFCAEGYTDATIHNVAIIDEGYYACDVEDSSSSSQNRANFEIFVYREYIMVGLVSILQIIIELCIIRGFLVFIGLLIILLLIKFNQSISYSFNFHIFIQKAVLLF